MLQRSPKLSPLEYADPKIHYADQKKAPVTPLESSDPNSLHAKSCRINTSKKYGGEGVLRSFVFFLYLLYFLSFLLWCHASLAQQPVKTLQPRPANSAEARPLDADLADAKSRLER